MDNVKIYLSGGISNLTFEEHTQWRKRIQDAIQYGGYDLSKTPVFFDPTRYYSVFEKEHKTEKEVMEFDLQSLRKSDLVVVNFNDKNSIGTAMELILAKENKIPVIGLNKDNTELHPWLIECCMRICSSYKELFDYLVNYFLL